MLLVTCPRTTPPLSYPVNDSCDLGVSLLFSSRSSVSTSSPVSLRPTQVDTHASFLPVVYTRSCAGYRSQSTCCSQPASPVAQAWRVRELLCCAISSPGWTGSLASSQLAFEVCWA